MNETLKTFVSLAICLLIVCQFNLWNDARAEQPLNVLLICVDDLRPELACFGATYIHSPNIDQLAARGRSFHRHYVNAPSCGPSRYTLLTGRYGPEHNHALFDRAKKIAEKPSMVPPSLPGWFQEHGYSTVSVGKVSHHPGGYGGDDWNDETKIEMPNAWHRQLMPVGAWQHPRGAMHGLANGHIRKKGISPIFEAVEGSDNFYPDGLIVDETLRQLDLLTVQRKQPFFLATGLIKPHLPFGAPKKYLDLYEKVELPPIPHPDKPEGQTTWHPSGEFMQNYNRWGKDPRDDKAFATVVRQHYAACVSYADASVGRILKKLEQTGADQHTIVILWGDHGWNLGEHAMWGKHNLFEEALRSPLVIYHPGIEKPGQKSDAVVETLDLFPTLCDLTGLPTPDFVMGQSLAPVLERPSAAGHHALSYWNGTRTLRTSTHRLIEHKNGAVELYDHTSPAQETENVASQHPQLVEELRQKIADKLKNGSFK